MAVAPSQDRELNEDVPSSTLILTGLLAAALLYCYLNTLILLTKRWQDPQYSHGWVVPLIAAALMWIRWDPKLLQSIVNIPTSVRWAGVGLLGAGLSLRLLASHSATESLELLSLLPSIGGLILLVWGWRIFLWSAPVIAFLAFMFPLPYRGEQMILVPLKHIASVGAEFCLQTLGYGAYREGNIIYVANVPMGVVDACSGLRMTTIFGAMCFGVALVISRPLWERLAVLASAIPIAVGVNVMRITATGMAHYYFPGPWVEKVFHVYAGWLMMPMAMVLLYIELQILAKLFVEERSVPVKASPLGTGTHPAPRGLRGEAG